MNGCACGAGVGAMGGVGVAASMEAPGMARVGNADADGLAEVGGVVGAVAVGVAATEAGTLLVETGVPPNAAGEAAATGLVGASVLEGEAGRAATAAAGAVPVAVCTAPVDMDGSPIAEASGMGFVGAVEGVVDALDVAVNALPDTADDTAAGDTGVLGAGCEATALKDAPVDAGDEEAVTVGAVGAGCTGGRLEAPIAEVADTANGADTEDGAVVGLEVPAADVGTDVATDAAGCDSEPEAVFVTLANEGVAASGVLFDVFIGAGAAAPGAIPMWDGMPATGAVCAAAKGSADNGFDHDAGAAESTDADSALAKVDAADAADAVDAVDAVDAAGVARCVSAGNGAVSPACFSAAFQTVPVTVSASVAFDAAKGAVVAAATAIASPDGRIGVAAIDEAGRGVPGATCWTGFTSSGVARVSCLASTDKPVSAGGADCGWNWPTIPAAVAASFASTGRPMSLAVGVTAAAGASTAACAATGSRVADSGVATGLWCDAPSPEIGELTMSSHGAKSIGASNAGAAGTSTSCRCSPSA